MFEANFDVYGYRFRVAGTDADVIEGIRQDFAFFASAIDSSDSSIELLREDPPRLDLPPMDASVYTPRNVTYRVENMRYIDYHGRGLAIRDDLSGSFRLYSRDPELLYEAAYLYMLSQAGQALDRKGLHRIHALGLVIKDRAVLVLLPMGGGKSTLGLHLLRHPEVKILSDDSPFVRRDGRLLAYPLRLGLLPGSEESVPPEHRRVINRMEFGRKHLVNYSYFSHRVVASADPGALFIGARMFGAGCRIEETGKLAGLRACIANCVVGVGLFQGLEFVLRSSAWELIKHAGLGLSRLRNCSRLVRRSRVCRIHLGNDAENNARTLLEYCSRL